MPNKILQIPDKILHLPWFTSFIPIIHISQGYFSCINKKNNTTYNHSKHKNIPPLAPGLLSLFLIIPWHVLNVPLMCHNYPGNTHLGRSIFVWGGTGADKTCGTLFPLIQIILHLKGDSIHMGKHPESTLDGPHNLWSIFLNIYAQRGNNHTWLCIRYDSFLHKLLISLGISPLNHDSWHYFQTPLMSLSWDSFRLFSWQLLLIFMAIKPPVYDK